MYTRNFESKLGVVKEQGIPVQSFEDTFSADAFIKSKQKEEHQQNEIYNKEPQQASIPEKNSEHKNISLDELLIAGLIVLLLGENNTKENSLLPIVLSLLLL